MFLLLKCFFAFCGFYALSLLSCSAFCCCLLVGFYLFLLVYIFAYPLSCLRLSASLFCSSALRLFCLAASLFAILSVWFCSTFLLSALLVLFWSETLNEF